MKKKHALSTQNTPQRRLSLFRVFIALLLLGGLGYSTVFGWDWWKESKVIANQKPWFAPYVDVTSKPTYAFEQLDQTLTPNVVLAFIVSSNNDPCVPTWGTYFTPDEAAASLDLDRRIARFQQQEGRVAISFGGALNSELALNCFDETALFQAYRSIIERYKIDTIDLDLENESLANTEAALRRARVIQTLQSSQRAEGKSLAVWLTLPVAPQGLTAEGTAAVTVMLRAGVDLAGVNLMTMNYGGSREEGMSMQKASERALIETHRQLGILYQQAGVPLSNRTLWRKIGATPMIGQNDVPEEVFTHEDAAGFNEFAVKHGVGRLSMWSLNRDMKCGDNYVDTTRVSDSCSGVKGERFAFARALAKGFDGDLAQNATIITVRDKETVAEVVDDPSMSPYQIWSEKGAYLKGTKVVWHGNVFEAKWWTKGDLPDSPVLQAWETPWQLVGPVLPGEKPVVRPTLPPDTYPQWDGTKVYDNGDRVLFENIPFVAKWWNQGQSPAASAGNADNSPWEALSDLEIREILEVVDKP